MPGLKALLLLGVILRVTAADTNQATLKPAAFGPNGAAAQVPPYLNITKASPTPALQPIDVQSTLGYLMQTAARGSSNPKPAEVVPDSEVLCQTVRQAVFSIHMSDPLRLLANERAARAGRRELLTPLSSSSSSFTSNSCTRDLPAKQIMDCISYFSKPECGASYAVAAAAKQSFGQTAPNIQRSLKDIRDTVLHIFNDVMVCHPYLDKAQPSQMQLTSGPDLLTMCLETIKPSEYAAHMGKAIELAEHIPSSRSDTYDLRQASTLSKAFVQLSTEDEMVDVGFFQSSEQQQQQQQPSQQRAQQQQPSQQRAQQEQAQQEQAQQQQAQQELAQQQQAQQQQQLAQQRAQQGPDDLELAVAPIVTESAFDPREATQAPPYEDENITIVVPTPAPQPTVWLAPSAPTESPLTTLEYLAQSLSLSASEPTEMVPDSEVLCQTAKQAVFSISTTTPLTLLSNDLQLTEGIPSNVLRLAHQAVRTGRKLLSTMPSTAPTSSSSSSSQSSCTLDLSSQRFKDCAGYFMKSACTESHAVAVNQLFGQSGLSYKRSLKDIRETVLYIFNDILVCHPALSVALSGGQGAPGETNTTHEPDRLTLCLETIKPREYASLIGKAIDLVEQIPSPSGNHRQASKLAKAFAQLSTEDDTVDVGFNQASAREERQSVFAEFTDVCLFLVTVCVVISAASFVLRQHDFKLYLLSATGSNFGNTVNGQRSLMTKKRVDHVPNPGSGHTSEVREFIKTLREANGRR